MNNKKSRKIKESPEWKWYQERLDLVDEYRRSTYENSVLTSIINKDAVCLNAMRTILKSQWDYHHGGVKSNESMDRFNEFLENETKG